jgi:hypothetical protein
MVLSAVRFRVHLHAAVVGWPLWYTRYLRMGLQYEQNILGPAMIPARAAEWRTEEKLIAAASGELRLESNRDRHRVERSKVRG